jgi:hypothetical protein
VHHSDFLDLLDTVFRETTFKIYLNIRNETSNNFVTVTSVHEVC